MARYAAAHLWKNINGPGDGRPTALQIVADEGLTGKLADKVYLVTGVSSGIGIETMRALYATGAHVFGTVRDMEKGQKVVDEVKTKTQGGQITLVKMEMDDMTSIKSGVNDFLAQSKTLNGLIANAGVMATPEGRTKDGFETQFGTCHIGHFYLFQLLKSTLLASATASFPSRYVSVASFGHRAGPVRFDDYNFEKPDSYNPWLGYGQAKTANIYMSNEIERRYGARHLHSTSLHPGGIWTGLQKHHDFESAKSNPEAMRYMKSAEQGAATSIYAALSAEWSDKGGKYLSNCVVEEPFSHPDDPMFVPDDGYATWAYDEKNEKQLWEDSLRMVGLPSSE